MRGAPEGICPLTTQAAQNIVSGWPISVEAANGVWRSRRAFGWRVALLDSDIDPLSSRDVGRAHRALVAGGRQEHERSTTPRGTGGG